MRLFSSSAWATRKPYGANLPGVQVITGLAQIYQQGKQDVEDWASFANPQAVKLTAEQVMGLYSNSLNGLTTSGGFKIPPAQGLIQFSLATTTWRKPRLTRSDPKLTQQKTAAHPGARLCDCSDEGGH